MAISGSCARLPSMHSPLWHKIEAIHAAKYPGEREARLMRSRQRQEILRRQGNLSERIRRDVKDRRRFWRLVGMFRTLGQARTCYEILEDTARKHGFHVEDLRSNRRGDNAMAMARLEFYYIAAKETQATFSMIGGLARKDHSTVLKGIRAWAKVNDLPMVRGINATPVSSVRHRRKRGG